MTAPMLPKKPLLESDTGTAVSAVRGTLMVWTAVDGLRMAMVVGEGGGGAGVKDDESLDEEDYP